MLNLQNVKSFACLVKDLPPLQKKNSMNNINILCQYKNWIFALKVPVWNYLLGKKYIVDFFLVFNVKTFFLYYFSPEQISLFINFLGATFFIDFCGFIIY